jgi:hypothetical protein
MIDLLLFFIGVVASITFGWKLREVYAQYCLNRVAQSLNNVEANTVEVGITRAQHMIYAHRADTGEVICQTTSADDMKVNLYNAFPDKIVVASRDSLDALVGGNNESV